MSVKDRVSSAAEATAESVREIRPLALPSNPWGALQLVQCHSQRNHNQSRQDQTHTRQGV